ncbi:hypothetical protein ACI3L3_00045 [Desulfobaculum sp. SPO524]|uniref:hypothetical protein n=1 Tax=Desulfobaculum sp. SPO524 TaxID=3378071 RepID=UPI0038531852
MQMLKKLFIITCACIMLATVVGCQDEGPAEKAGKKIDQAVDSLKDKADKLME